MPTNFCILPLPVRQNSEQHVVWCFHFIWCPLILTVVCLTALEGSLVHNNSGHMCFQIDILDIHRNHRSIIAIITIAIIAVISITIVLSAIVVALSLPSSTYHTCSTSSSKSSILFLLPSSSSYILSSSLYIGHHTCTLIWYIATCCVW